MPTASSAPSRGHQRSLIRENDRNHETSIQPDRKEVSPASFLETMGMDLCSWNSRQVQDSWSTKIAEDRSLEQDEMEGVSEEEWTEAL